MAVKESKPFYDSLDKKSVVIFDEIRRLENPRHRSSPRQMKLFPL